jgi:hypothetical protein
MGAVVIRAAVEMGDADVHGQVLTRAVARAQDVDFDRSLGAWRQGHESLDTAPFRINLGSIQSANRDEIPARRPGKYDPGGLRAILTAVAGDNSKGDEVPRDGSLR